MSRLFVRFYVALVAVIALLVAVLVALDSADDALPDRLRTAAAAPALVARTLAGATDPAARDTAAAQLSEKLAAPVSVIPLAQAEGSLPNLDRDRLQRGEPVASGPTLLVRVPDQPFVAVVGTAHPERDGHRIAVLVTLVTTGLGLAVFATLWPLQRQLTRLADAARRLGTGDLHARADVVTTDAAGELATSFNTMADRVEHLVKAREELLLAVSHELRTPVARVRFALELLPEHDDVAAIQRDLDLLDALVAELLEYASLEDGRRKPVKARLDLMAFLAERVDEAGRLAADVHVSLRGPEERWVEADARLLQRAFGNLLANAVRYGRGRVEVTVEGDDVLFDDDGLGIPEADRERAFDPLVRLDSARGRDTGGVGLGLALARRVAEAHGGRLVAEASPLGGARMRFSLR